MGKSHHRRPAFLIAGTPQPGKFMSKKLMEKNCQFIKQNKTTEHFNSIFSYFLLYFFLYLVLFFFLFYSNNCNIFFS
ncbi:hypothetical protein Mgra_00009326, partial [Meloidogyne graminicola]